MFSSLRWRITAAFGLVIVLAVGLIAIVTFVTTRIQFNLLLSEEARTEASFIAAYVEGQYNLEQDWQDVKLQMPNFATIETWEALNGEYDGDLWDSYVTEEELEDLEAELYEIPPHIDRALAAALNISWPQYQAARQTRSVLTLAEEQNISLDTLIRAIVVAEKQEYPTLTRRDMAPWLAIILSDAEYYLYNDPLDWEEYEDSSTDSDAPYADLGFASSQALVTDAHGAIILDTRGELIGTPLPASLSDKAVPVYNWQTGEVVGQVAVATGDGFYGAEELEFLSDVAFFFALGGLLAIVVALVVGMLLAQQITAPVTALTEAATYLAHNGHTRPLPDNSSSELGQMSRAFNHMAKALNTQQMLRQRLIADVSHELNTPLSIIRLEAKGLGDGMQTPEEAAARIIREVE